VAVSRSTAAVAEQSRVSTKQHLIAHSTIPPGFASNWPTWKQGNRTKRARSLTACLQSGGAASLSVVVPSGSACDTSPRPQRVRVTCLDDSMRLAALVVAPIP